MGVSLYKINDLRLRNIIPVHMWLCDMNKCMIVWACEDVQLCEKQQHVSMCGCVYIWLCVHL